MIERGGGLLELELEASGCGGAGAGNWRSGDADMTGNGVLIWLVELGLFNAWSLVC
jgi:hypothetical protein